MIKEKSGFDRLRGAVTAVAVASAGMFGAINSARAVTISLSTSSFPGSVRSSVGPAGSESYTI